MRRTHLTLYLRGFFFIALLVYIFHIITFTGLCISYYYIYWFIYFILLHLLVYLFHIITFTGLYISYYYIYWFIYFILLHLLVYIFQMMFQYTTSIIALVAVIYWYRYKPHPDQVFNIQLNSSYDYIIGKLCLIVIL